MRAIIAMGREATDRAGRRVRGLACAAALLAGLAGAQNPPAGGGAVPATIREMRESAFRSFGQGDFSAAIAPLEGLIAAAQTAIAAYNAAEAAAPATRVWIPEVPTRPPGRAGIKEGAKADPGSPAIPGHWQVVQHHPGGVARPAMPAPPPMPPPGKWKLPDFVQHISLLYDANYKPKGLKPPVISCIGYQIDKDGGAFLNQLSANYKGQYRLVRKMR
jgi:hypothetical protein